jgi:serine/threonine protein phosphatase PrpC
MTNRNSISIRYVGYSFDLNIPANTCVDDIVLQVSKSAEQGVRWTMEDTYTVANGGHFAAVFDGHGGSGVSGMLRDHVHRLYSKALYQRHGEEIQRSALDSMQVDDDESKVGSMKFKSSVPSIKSHIASIRGALKRIERESMRHDHFEYQGSTAVVVLVHVGENGERTLVSANVGDSRAILCRGRKAVDLTRDHKPSDEREKARIRSMGEDVQWDPYGEIYRVKDLSLSRAIGDRFAKPVVSSEAEIDCLPVNEEEDEFFVSLYVFFPSVCCKQFVRWSCRLDPFADRKALLSHFRLCL